MDEHGFAKLPREWSRRGLWIAAAIAGTALVIGNYYFIEQLFAAFVLYSAVTIPLLILVFILEIAEEAGIEGLARMGKLLLRVRHGLEVPPARPLGQQRQKPVRPLVFAPRLMREFHKANKGGFHQPTRRHAA